LTLLSAAPGIGKTSWMLRMLLNAAALGVPSVLGCYEQTEDELKFRLGKQAQATVATAHMIARVVYRMLKYKVEYKMIDVGVLD
jgi:predicted ATP-dependent serine protease